jgi:lysyl-tRNA synthetase, class II
MGVNPHTRTVSRSLVRVERHALGPRVYVAGRRVHEWHLGAGILAALVAAALAGALTGGVGWYFAATGGAWLVAKDWRDLTRSGRDTAAWRIGFHRRPTLVQPPRRGDWVPALAAVMVAATAVASIISAVTPDVVWRGHVIARMGIVQLAAVFHAAVIPIGAALLLTSYSLWRRRNRAYRLGLVLLVVLGVLNLVKGLDFEEATLSFAAAGLLWWARDSFVVRPSRIPVRGSLGAAALLIASTAAIAAAAVASSASGRPSMSLVARTTVDLLTWEPAPLAFRDEFQFVPQAIGCLGVLSVVAAAWVLFRPLSAPRELPDEEERHLARNAVRLHGSDTLAYFQLRDDKHYFWTPNRQGFLAYRIENGVLLVSGDPVASAEDRESLILDAYHYAEQHSLRFGVIGASADDAGLYRRLGLKTMYVGDEAIVAPAAFSLDGRPVRKVRQSVARLERLGYRVEFLDGASVQPALESELQAVSAAWRGEQAERGFSMALDRLSGPMLDDTRYVLARDPKGLAVGFLQLVPSYGRAALSMGLMRRLPDAPNGLMEFLIVRTIQRLSDEGIGELSLNFAAFGRLLRSPTGRAERLARRLLRIADRWFQVERLYRFNAKFSPTWQPRYLVYQSSTSFPRTALAVMWAEGQAPKPAVRRPIRGRPVTSPGAGGPAVAPPR